MPNENNQPGHRSPLNRTGGRTGKFRPFRRRNKVNMFSAVQASPENSANNSLNSNPSTKPRENVRENARENNGPRPVGDRNPARERRRDRSSNRRSRMGGNNRGRMNMVTRPSSNKETPLPPLAPDSIRIIPLGGVEEVGKNMTVIEYDGDIVIVDIGFQFRDENTPGVDYILPNTRYLEENKERIKAVFITHGHLDHIGGIPYVMSRIGNPPLYTRTLTSVIIKKRQDEFPHLPPLDIRLVETEDTVTVGKFKVNFWNVTHTIPDSMGVIIQTPLGAIVNPGDVKLEHEDGIVVEREIDEYEKFKKYKVLCLLLESTNVENPGFSTPEKLVHKNLEEIIRAIKGRLIIGTFASQFERIIKIVEAAERFNKKVVIEGRSMKSNIEIAKYTGRLKTKEDTIIPVERMDDYPPDRIIVLATGAQGDEFAALMRMSQKTHKYVKISKRDTVLLSSSIIPGNEKAVQKLKDNLSRQGAKIIHYRTSEVYIHSTGHANKSELEWIHKAINPKFFVPIHGNHYMLRVHEELAQGIGMPPENIIVPDNGTVMEIQNGGEKFVRLKETVPNAPVLVDGFSIGDMQEVVMRDRKMLAEDGMFVIIASINMKTGKLKKSPDIISRGFVYLRESQELLSQARLIIKKTIEGDSSANNAVNFDEVKTNLSDNIARFLFQKTAKRPLVIPVILGI